MSETEKTRLWGYRARLDTELGTEQKCYFKISIFC